jgi:two-component system NtrC family sensor kinase
MDKARILYIESDEIQRKTVSSALRSKGYRVTVAASEQIGFRLFEKKTFDVILCDLNLPKIDGIEVLERIRCINLNIPFIIFAARGSVAQAKKAIKKGATHFVLKPKDIHEIVIIIEQVIERNKLQKVSSDSQAFMQTVIENVPDIIYSLNPKGEFISLSPSVEHVMGYKPSELMGVSVFKIIHPNDRLGVKESFMSTAKSVDTRDKIIQFRMVTKTGETKHFEIRRKMAIENGRMVRNDGVARDITHRIILEQKLKNYHQQMVKANLDMQAVQDELRAKNDEMENLLKEQSRNKDELQTVIDSIPDVIFLVDQKGIIKATNRSVFDYFGVSPDEIIDSSHDEFIDMIKSNFEDFDKFLEGQNQCKKAPDCAGQLSVTDIYKRGVRVIKHKPGILSPTCFRVQDKDNNDTGLVWVYTDVSFIKHADEQVHTIVDSSPIPTIISRLEDGTILYANEELARLVGLTTEELIGKNTPDFYYNREDRKTVVESLRRDGYLRNFETQIKKADGSVVWMIFSLVIAHVGGEEVLLGWLYDISERKKTEEALRVSEERFRSLVENANDVIYSLTPKGEISYLSPKFTDILGYEISEYLGKSFSLLMHPDDLKKSIELVQREMKTGQQESGFEFRIKHKEGHHCWFVSHSSVILDDSGNVMELVGVAHDITEMKKILDDLELANETLRETQAQLVQSEKMASLGSLVAGIAHEINTPIGAVSSMYDTLSRSLEKLDEIIKSKFPADFKQLPRVKSIFKILDDSNQVIRSGTERVVDIVRRLKSFARLDEAELKTVDIHEGLEDTLILIHHELKHNIRIIKKFGDIPLITCFPGQLNQVFLNLLINSKQSIKDKGTIRITTFAKNKKVHIVFQDNGIGISKANISKVFDPGFTTKGRGVGAGLGLSICYQIIQDHRGWIKVESEPGKGTTFTIVLPTDLEEILEKEKNQG